MTHVSPPPATPLKLNPSAILTLDTGAYPDEREVVAKLTGFPNLGDDFDVLAPATGHPDHPKTFKPGVTPYNCIAWTVDKTDKWEWPGKLMVADDGEIKLPATVQDFDDLYASVGLKRAEYVDTKVEAGVRKVALYGKLTPAGHLKLTHGAKQEEDGTWTSKLGGEPLIRHRTAEQVSGSEYGNPVAVYVGKR